MSSFSCHLCRSSRNQERFISQRHPPPPPSCFRALMVSVSEWYAQGYPADPLLHACIVCASASCPDVATKVYRPETIDEDMAANMRHFLANEKKGLMLDKAAGVITLSKVRAQFRPPNSYLDCQYVCGHATKIMVLREYPNAFSRVWWWWLSPCPLGPIVLSEPSLG